MQWISISTFIISILTGFFSFFNLAPHDDASVAAMFIIASSSFALSAMWSLLRGKHQVLGHLLHEHIGEKR